MIQRINLSLLFFILFCSGIFAQTEGYTYRRKLSGISGEWHSIELPNSLFKHLKEDLSDIRIIGITPDNDTIEAPYLVNINATSTDIDDVYGDIINESNIKNRYYYTIENYSWEKTNSMELRFSDDNFDWKVKLEGSNNQKTWYTILSDARILSINNEFVNYEYTTLNFPTSKYGYYRISFKSNSKPDLYDVQLSERTKDTKQLKNHTLQSFKITNNKEDKTTIIDLKLEEKVPVSMVKIEVEDNFDYYRPIEIQRLIDSVNTPDGWKPYYDDLSETILSSLESDKFNFNYAIADVIQVIISNNDNNPLNIGKVTVEGNIISLTCRFDQEAEYYLYYGNENTWEPYYDIGVFEENIPLNLTGLNLGKEETLIKEASGETIKPTLSSIWLWIIMAIIILIIGGFTISMLKNNKEEEEKKH